MKPSKKAEQLTTNNNYLFDKLTQLILVVCHFLIKQPPGHFVIMKTFFVCRLSFMINRNFISFLSCSASVEHDKFLID